MHWKVRQETFSSQGCRKLSLEWPLLEGLLVLQSTENIVKLQEIVFYSVLLTWKCQRKKVGVPYHPSPVLAAILLVLTGKNTRIVQSSKALPEK